MQFQLTDGYSLSREVLLLLSVLFAAYVAHGLWRFAQRFRTRLRKLRGPPRYSWVFGNIPVYAKDKAAADRWREEYGDAYAMPSVFGTVRLSTADPRAVGHILSHADTYPKPDHMRFFLGATLGEGLLVAEGETHKRQRRIMNPSFSPGQIREVTPIFFDTAHQLRDVLNSMLSKSVTADGKEVGMEVDVFSWVGRAALDIIGLAGFGYRFNALYDESNELFRAFHDMFQAMSEQRWWGLLSNRFKILRLIPSKRDRVMKASMRTTERIGMQLVRSKKAAVQLEIDAKRDVEKSKIVGRDMLSALIRANMAADLAPAHRMSDEEVLAQISTFIVAVMKPPPLDKLRAELLLVPDESPSMDELNDLPYLDMVVKESLRFHSPVHGTMRFAAQADTIPLSRPIIDRYGKQQDHIQLAAGDAIGLDILVMNKSKDLWGEDAGEFRPERWGEEMGRAGEIPGVWSHLMTFIGGPRACIGYRFSIIEMKALIFTLLREFEFAPVPGMEIGIKNMIVARPCVVGQEKLGLRLPMIVKRVSKAL